ncbi:hypothetical protein [Amycolatopsis pithecellobii]|uniref:Uncharacterized protein n=1 Tax=Amycolatopsis pithecellobii TaxID=664692 RepID=A0A6N7ZAT1_9PSEU|nr:hypothetical protein [Amycolatopsis pithecellobii]MTD58840.1 hypothetical protein [Amycolatopsis pithecellobii]
MSREVLAFVPQHTTTKSRIMAIVDKGRGHEIDAVTTVDWPHEAVALCNILNAAERGHEQVSGLWAALPASARASLAQARDQRVNVDDARFELATLFITPLTVPSVPEPDPDIPWAELFPTTGCPAGGCDTCTGCPAHAKARGEDTSVNQCGPGGSCSCVTAESDDEEPCACTFLSIGPRWAAAIHQSLAEAASILVERAEDLMWGVEGPAVGFPGSLAAQPPEFFVRLAQTCIDLCNRLTSGRPPIPDTLADLLMLDEAARSYLDSFVGNNGLDIEDIKQEWPHLPEAPGDFELDALWMLQIAEDEWLEIAESHKIFDPNSMNHIFDKLPESA